MERDGDFFFWNGVPLKTPSTHNLTLTKRMSDFFENVRFNKMADFYMDEINQARKRTRQEFSDYLKNDSAAEMLANRFHLTYQEAEDALSVVHSKQAMRIDLKFPITTAGLRKLATYRTGVIDCIGESVVQCIESPMYFVDWVFQHMNLSLPFVEFGRIPNNQKWKRCESTGLWFYDKKPELRCNIELCSACVGFSPVYETIREVKLKFFFFDKTVKSLEDYLTFYNRFYELSNRNKIVVDLKSPTARSSYSMRVFRMMLVKRYATGDMYFRYCMSESYVKDYLDVHHKQMFDQLADLPLAQATQVVNTCLNDTIVMATEEEVRRWIDSHLNNGSKYVTDLEGSFELAGQVNESALPLALRLLPDKDDIAAPSHLRNASPDFVPFTPVLLVHRDIPVQCKVSWMRREDYFDNVRKMNKVALRGFAKKHLYVFTKQDWYLPIPPFVEIENSYQLKEVWDDGEGEDGCMVTLSHDFQYIRRTDGKEVALKKGEELYVNLEQMDNYDDYPWEILNSDRELDVYLFRVEVGEMLSKEDDSDPDSTVVVEIFKEYGRWHAQKMEKHIAFEIFYTPWDDLIHTKPSEYNWK